MLPALWAAGIRESINLIASRQTAAHNALRGVGYDSDTLRQQGAVGGKEISNKYMLCAAVGLIARRYQVYLLRWA